MESKKMSGLIVAVALFMFLMGCSHHGAAKYDGAENVRMGSSHSEDWGSGSNRDNYWNQWPYESGQTQ